MKKKVPWETSREEFSKGDRVLLSPPQPSLTGAGFQGDSQQRGHYPCLRACLLQAKLPMGTRASPSRMLKTHRQDPNLTAVLDYPLAAENWVIKEDWEVLFIFNRMSFPTRRQYIFFWKAGTQAISVTRPP